MADASLIGYQFPSFSFTVEAGKLREFSQAILWEEGAQVPPTYSTTASFWSPAETGPGLGLDVSRILAGGNEWEYPGRLTVGDVLTVHTEITDVYQKVGKRGPMTIVVREARFVNQRSETVLVQRSNIIEMPAPTPPGHAVKEGT